MLSVIFCLAAISGCTTSAWIVKEEPVPDPESERILAEEHKFLPVDTPTPRNPVISLDLVKERELQYNLHLASERYIQEYRPRYGYLALGLVGMGAGLYVANSSVFDADKLSDRNQAMLNVTAVGIGAASFLSMKPVGEQRPADEQRLLQKTDTHTRKDTIKADLTKEAEAWLTIVRGEDSLVSGKHIPITDNNITIHLGRQSGLQQLSEDDTTAVKARIQYKDFEYEQSFQVTDFMQKFVEVTTDEVPLRTDPANLSDNIIRHVASDSRFLLLNDIDDQWYHVHRSGGSAYIRKEHTREIWHTADMDNMEDLIVQPDQSVFGDIEIERNLPANHRNNPDGIALVIINGNYHDPVRNLPNAARTAELVTLYLNRVLGYYSDNIRVFEDMTGNEMTYLLEESDSLMIGDRYLSMDESDLFVYYYGHSITDEDGRLSLLPVDYKPGEANERVIPLEKLVKTLTNLRSRQLVTVLDTDWSTNTVYGHSSSSGGRSPRTELTEFSAVLPNDLSDTAFFWAAQSGQHSEAYIGTNGRPGYPYDIFTWYFFKALQEGAHTTGAILQELQRNVPFTSRRLHDRPQEPGFAGNRELSLTGE